MNSLDEIVKTTPVLSDAQIHVFLFQLNSFNVNDLFLYLSDDEVTRADKLKVEQKRNQFVITRGLLRVLLSNCLAKQPEEIVFSYAQHCKPYINEQLDNKPVEFNISHSGDYAIIAMTLENKVGVDIEAINAEIDYQSLSNRFFSGKEKNELAMLDKAEQLEAFYQIWTRKESFIKAIGQGVAFGLDNFSVPVQNNKNTEMEVVMVESIKEEWFCYELIDLNNYKTALTSCRKGLDIIMST